MIVFLLIGASWIYHRYTLLDWTPNARPFFKRHDGIHGLSSFIWGATLSGSSPDASWTLTSTAWAPLQHLFSSNGIFHLLLYSHRFSNTTYDTIYWESQIIHGTCNKLLHFWRLRLRLWRFAKLPLYHLSTIFGGWGWGYDDSQSYLCISFLYYFGWRLRLRLWRFAKLPLYHFIFSYHTSSHITTLFGYIHRKSFMAIHSKLIWTCFGLMRTSLLIPTYFYISISTYKYFNSSLHNIAILQRRGGDVV